MARFGVAIIGASARSTMMFGYLQDNPDAGFITGVYDVIPVRSEFMLNHYKLNDATIYESLDQAASDPRANAAFVSTTDCEHAAASVTALQAGKHVYCEKPMAITLADCDAIIAAARKSGSVFYVGMNLRHGPVHEAVHAIVSAGQLGKVLTIEANEYYYGGRTYFRRWNRLRKFGGGLWLTKCCHDFDLLNWMAGGRPTRVYATSSLSHYKPKGEAGTRCRDCPIRDECPDVHKAVSGGSFPWNELAQAVEKATGTPRDLCLYNSDKDTFDNGVAIVEYDNDVRTTYTVNVVTAITNREIRIMGTEASLEGDMHSGLVTVWRRHTDQKTTTDVRERTKGGHGGADRPIVEDFFRCCQTGEAPRSSWADGRSSVEVGLAARKSCDTGQAVTLPDPTLP